VTGSCDQWAYLVGRAGRVKVSALVDGTDGGRGSASSGRGDDAGRGGVSLGVCLSSKAGSGRAGGGRGGGSNGNGLVTDRLGLGGQVGGGLRVGSLAGEGRDLLDGLRDEVLGLLENSGAGTGGVRGGS
jgi:hypothetical protein